MFSQHANLCVGVIRELSEDSDQSMSLNRCYLVRRTPSTGVLCGVSARENCLSPNPDGDLISWKGKLKDPDASYPDE